MSERVAPPSWPFRRTVRFVGNALRDYVITPLIVRHWVTLHVEGAEHLDHLRGPSIFIFNHSDDFDGPVTYASLPSHVRSRLSVAAGSDIMENHRILAFIIRLCYAGFGFERYAHYRASMDYLAGLLASGRHVLLSPEGRLSPSGELLDFKGGIGLLAVRLGVDVVPMRIHGLTGTVPLHAHWPKRHSEVTVRIGEPRSFGPQERHRDVTRRLREAVAAL